MLLSFCGCYLFVVVVVVDVVVVDNIVVVVESRTLKFGKNWVSNSYDMNISWAVFQRSDRCIFFRAKAPLGLVRLLSK